MENQKFNIGDKVIPICKSTHSSLEDSTTWKKAKKRNQDFLYITGSRMINVNGKGKELVYTCHEDNSWVGYYFLP